MADHCTSEGTGLGGKQHIVIGNVGSITSTILGEQRRIWVYVPDKLPSKINSIQRYPVVYLLDSSSVKPSGGGKNFIAFVEKELMPYVGARW